MSTEISLNRPIESGNRDSSNRPSPDAPETRHATARIGTAVWRASTSYTVLLGTAAVALALVCIALLIPQLPSQLQSSPAAASRWLLTARTQYGVLGSFFGALGLFDLLHNPAFRLLLAALLYLLMAQAARLTGIALALRRLPDQVSQEIHEPGAPIRLPATLALVRRRTRAALAASEAPAAAAAQLEPDYAQIIPYEARQTISQESMRDDPSAAEKEQPAEWIDNRLLAHNALAFALLRPVAALGLALAVAGLWINAQQGWDVTVPPLAAGESYRHPPRDLEIAYTLDDSAENLSVGLHILLGDEEATLPVSASTNTRIGGVQVRAAADIPGVVIRTRPASVLLAQPGEPATSAAIGLRFPMVASEESLLIPDEAVGIRLVRLPRREERTSPFIVELYSASQTAASQSERLDLTDIHVLSVDESDVDLELTPVPGLSISLRSAPGTPLIRLGLVLALFGAVGWLRRPRFVLLQSAPWDNEAAVITVQSNAQAGIDALTPLFEMEEAA